jgi:electron transfer flavoprotein alpha subunit
MAEILVLAEHAGDDVKKVTLELITLARRFGEPSVVWTGPGVGDLFTVVPQLLEQIDERKAR